MKKLTEPAFWNRRHDSFDAGRARGWKGTLEAALRRAVGDRAIESLHSYDDHLLWDVLLPKHLPKGPAKVLEVGSAPGNRLVRFHRAFGYEPFGVEYAPAGVRVNRRLFEEAGLDPANVVEADFFSDAFLEAHREKYDVVFSTGFIEHFSDPARVVDRHVTLARPGGHVVVAIPNLLGWNRLTTFVFDKALLPVHNLELMRPETFRAAFDSARLEPLYCDFYGTFRLSVIGLADRPWKERVRSAFANLQPPLNAAFRAAFPEGRAESRFTSPYLLFIGRKRAA